MSSACGCARARVCVCERVRAFFDGVHSNVVGTRESERFTLVALPDEKDIDTVLVPIETERGRWVHG